MYAKRLGVPPDGYGDLPPDYNVTPGRSCLLARSGANDTGISFVTYTWGFVPHWSKDPAKGPRPVNARAETVAAKPFFRAAFRHGRCLVPADGYFEWREESGQKQPYYFRLKGGEPMFFAGLWSRWHGGGREVLTFTIIVTAPNTLAAEIHDRMPAIVAPEHCHAWLNPMTDLQEAQAFLAPYPAAGMEYWPVSRLVNNPKNRGPEVIRPFS